MNHERIALRRKIKEQRNQEIIKSFSSVTDYMIDFRVCGQERTGTFLHVMVRDMATDEIIAHWHPSTNSLRIGHDLGFAVKIDRDFENIKSVVSYLNRYRCEIERY